MDKLSIQILLVSGITSILVVTIFLLIVAIGIIMLVLVYQKRQVQYLKENENLKISFEKELLKSQMEIQEQTLGHLSRELHDNLGQVASLIKINLSTISLGEVEKAAEKIENTKDLTRQLIADIKSLSVSLGSDLLTQVGLVKAIETEVDRLNKTGEFVADLVAPPDRLDIAIDKEIILYRMVQEILNNIVKHSAARHVHILLGLADQRLLLAVDDDGRGFEPETNVQTAGAGLRNLKSRALLINAQLTINSTPGAGTHIKIDLPL